MMSGSPPKSISAFDPIQRRSGLVYFALPAILVSQILGFFISSYFGIELSGSLIYHADDGWCDTTFQGIGKHCFGDFSSFMNYDVASPWSNSFPTAYPPLSVLLMAMFKWLHSITNQGNISLLIYLTLLIISLVSPAYFFVKSGLSKLKTLTIFLFLLLSGPSLMIIDRGNNLGFCVPLIFLAYYFALQKRYFHFQFIIVLLTLLKPQFGLLSVLLLLNKQTRMFLVFILNTSLSYCVFFLFFGPNELISNISNWFVNLFQYQSYASLPMIYPNNISFANLVALPIAAFSKINPEFESVIKEVLGKPLFVTSISIVFLLTILVTLFARRNKLNDLQMITTLLISLIMVPSVSFSYYLSVLLPLIYLLVYSSFLEGCQGQSRFSNFIKIASIQIESTLKTRFQRWIFKGFIITCLINWPIPWIVFGISPVGGNSGNLSIVWIVSPLFLFLFLITLLFGNLKLRFKRSHD